MISIAICDDNSNESLFLECQIENCLGSRHIPYRKKVFSDGKNLLYEIADRTPFDIFLLDIEMPEIDGITLAERIKTVLPHALLIFITSYEKYVYESFKIQPFRFIPKRCIDQMLPAALSDAVKMLKDNADKYYLAENQQGLEKIAIQDITHIWHREKYAYIEKLNRQTTKIRKTLRQVYSELPEDDFIWADRGCICNIAHITRITGTDIVLTTGIRIAVSRDRLMDLKDKLRRYWITGEEK